MLMWKDTFNHYGLQRIFWIGWQDTFGLRMTKTKEKCTD